MLRSIRWTLQLWHAGLLATVLTAFGAVTFYEIRRARLAQVDAELERAVQLIAAGVRPPAGVRDGRGGPRPGGDGRPDRPDDVDSRERGPRPPPPPPGFDRPPPGVFDGAPRGPEVNVPAALVDRFERPLDGAYFVVWGRDGEELRRSAGAPPLPAPTALRPGPRGPPTPEPPVVTSRGDARQATVVGPFGVRVVVGRSIAVEQADLRRLAWLMVATGAGVMLVGLAGGLALASRVTRPIRTITAAAESISANSLAARIDVDDTESELGRLAAVLNGTFGRLDVAFRQQVRFTGDASHELRTPLAVMHSAAQLALSRDRSSDDYRKALQTCHRASSRMKELVDSLLLLAGADAGQLSLDRTRVELADVARECADLLTPLATEKGVTIDSDYTSAIVSADASRMKQVLTNLLSNAIRYNRDGGRVRVTVRPHAGAAELTVADTGIGISPDHQAHLFERFYRVDPARSRAEGGSGLGLAIGRSIVLAHGGTIEVVSAAGQGTTFTVRLPLEN